MRVLTLDPSGNHSEGSGTTGWALFENGELKDFGDVAAKDFRQPEVYWRAVAELIVDQAPQEFVCESYKLFAHKSKQQHWSEMETPQLIGFLRVMWYEYMHEPIIFQDPAIKTRVADPILEHMGVIEKKGGKYYCMGRMTNLHQRDAIRHGIYYHRYNKE